MLSFWQAHLSHSSNAVLQKLFLCTANDTPIGLHPCNVHARFNFQQTTDTGLCRPTPIADIRIYKKTSSSVVPAAAASYACACILSASACNAFSSSLSANRSVRACLLAQDNERPSSPACCFASYLPTRYTPNYFLYSPVTPADVHLVHPLTADTTERH